MPFSCKFWTMILILSKTKSNLRWKWLNRYLFYFFEGRFTYLAAVLSMVRFWCEAINTARKKKVNIREQSTCKG